MALPLLWLGAAALSAMAVKELSDDRNKIQIKRRRSYKAQALSMLNEHESPVALYPSDILTSIDKNNITKVKPKVGAIVCCGIGGILDHTGIWVGDDTIIELDGNGLIKPISSNRFIKERSGKQIYILCDSLGEPLAIESVAKNAIEQIYQCIDYHLVDNNCHQFVWQCFNSSTTKKNSTQVSTFKQLNIQLAHCFNRVLYWDILSS